MNRINPKKLLHSKWTALDVQNKEKHFMVTKLIVEEGNITACFLEAVLTKRVAQIDWRELKDASQWCFGWQ